MKKEFDTISIFLRTFGIFGVILGVLFFSGTIFANSGGGFFKIGSPASVAAKGMVGYWPLDAASMKNASTTADLTPNGNDGTLYGRALADRLTTDSKGVANGAMSFDGVGDYVSVPFSRTKTIQPGETISTWVYRKGAGVGDSAGIVNIMGSTDNNHQSGIQTSDTNDDYVKCTGIYELATVIVGISSPLVPLPLNTWTHITCVYDYDGTDMIISMYKDSVFSGSSSNTVDSYDFPSNNIRIGVQKLTASRYFNGSISGVRIYNYALSQSEITQLYDDYKPKVVIDSLEKGLVGHWPLDSASMKSASTTADVTPNGNDGTLYGRALASRLTTDRKGVTNSAMEFDGVGDYVSVSNSESLNINSNKVSASVWVKLNKLPNELSASYAGIYGSSQDSYVVYEDKGTNELRFKVIDADGTAERPGIPSSDLNIGVWIFVTGVYDGDSGNAYIYLNGVLRDTHTNASLTGIVKPGQIAQIGVDDDGTANFFNGSLSDVRIYNRALSQAEITRLYDNYKPKIVINSLNKGLVGYWPLDSKSMKSASTTADLTPQGNDGTLYGRALADRLTTDRKGVANGAMEFDGVGDYVDAGTFTAINNTNFTVSFWAKMNNYTASVDRFVSLGSSGVMATGIVSGKFAVLTSNDSWKYATQLPTNNKWYHFVWVYDGANDIIYIDGAFDSSQPDSNILDNSDSLLLGKTVTTIRQFNGSLSDVRIYNRALSADEVKMLYEKY